jgi:tetratricopeptide (TPR) repeat protein
MKKVLVLLCLGLIGCTAASKESKVPFQATERPMLAVEAKTTAKIKYIPFDENDINNLISVFSEAIKDRPNFVGFYYNRGIAYFYKKDYDKSWQDVHKAESLGYKFDVDFIKSLKKASGRER